MKPAITICAAFTIAILASCSQSNDIIERRSQLDLSGKWHTQIGVVNLPGTTDENGLGDGQADTLGTGKLARIKPFEGIVFYDRDIEIPASFVQKHISLFIEKTKPSTLWIDGDSIGYIGTLHNPHIYDVSQWLTPGKHHIRLAIDNSPSSVPQGIQGSHAWTDHTQTNWNGILGKFYLEASPRTHISAVDVYPSVAASSIKISIKIFADKPHRGRIETGGHSWNEPKGEHRHIPKQTIDVELNSGVNEIEMVCNMGQNPLLWSEFSPSLYKLNVELDTEEGPDNMAVDFGMRDFTTQGTQFIINGKKTFLRGKHDACVFPLTGYAPMTVKEWRNVFQIAKSYGINHYRFHSWTPPEAAFEAADIEGIYLQAELPYWGTLANDTTLNNFLMREGKTILNAFGNHPSFTMMALGNELNGDLSVMQQFVNDFKRQDKRHLYAFGSNNNLGFAGQVDGEDFFVTCRVGRENDSCYNTHVRSSFSFADAYKGGILNGTYPSTRLDYTEAISHSTVPVVSHENCQFQIYPDYAEIDKYTGVLYPYNLVTFRQRLIDAGLSDQADDFHKATGKFSMECYKADIEMCMRTQGFGGFQMLDLQDYPGQGSALVGILDAFMQSKGITTPEYFRQFCNSVVPMAKFDSYCIEADKPFETDIVVANYSIDDITDTLRWKITNCDSTETIANGLIAAKARQGDVSNIGHLDIPINKTDAPQQIKLWLSIGKYTNSYNLWAFPPQQPKALKNINVSHKLDAATIQRLNNGQSILYIPQHTDIEQLSVGGLFTPDYWNYAMFKGISEWLKREVSPGTMSILVNPEHPLFASFPTQMQSDWQWWAIARNSRPFILYNTGTDYKPIVQVIDNVERNHKLGIVFEFSVGKGRLLVCTCNLAAITDKLEGQQFAQAIAQYMESDSFNPITKITSKELKQLFSTKVKDKKIIGEKNITSYE